MRLSSLSSIGNFMKYSSRSESVNGEDNQFLRCLYLNFPSQARQSSFIGHLSLLLHLS